MMDLASLIGHFAMLHNLNAAAQYIVVMYESLPPHITQIIFIKVTSKAFNNKAYKCFHMCTYRLMFIVL